MRIIQTSFFLLIMTVALLGFRTAFAGAGTPVTPDSTSAMLWLVVGMSASAIWGAGARWLTGRFAFFHNGVGLALITLVGAVVGAVAPVVQHGWNGPAAASAALSAIVAFLGAVNSGQAGQNAAARATGGLVEGPGPTITKAPAFIPIAFAVLFSFAGCAHVSPMTQAYVDAFGACMEQHGLIVAPGIAQEVWTDLSTGANQATIVAQLEQIAGRASIDSVTCAVTSWFNAPPALAERNPAGVAAANAFLAHPVRVTLR